MSCFDDSPLDRFVDAWILPMMTIIILSMITIAIPFVLYQMWKVSNS